MDLPVGLHAVSLTLANSLEIRDIEAAHWPHLEAPEDVNRMMEDFLGKLEMRTSSETLSRSVREEL